MKKARPFFYLILILLVQSCVDIPDDVALPEYDVKFTIPVADRSYTLQEAVEEDSTNLKWSKDPSDYGLLYFTDEIKLEKINVDNNLKVDPFSTASSNFIGAMKLENVSGIETEINYSSWGVSVSPGLSPFPPVQTDVNSAFTLIGDFTTAVFDQTNDPNVNVLSLTFANKFPVEVKVNGLRIENVTNGKIVAETSDVIVIPTNDIKTITFDLSQKEVAQNVVFKGNLQTDGSSGNSVNITNNDKLEIDATFSPKLLFSQATAKLPAQVPVTKNAAFTVDDSTKLSAAVIKTGSFNFRFENTLDVDINMVFTSPSLKTSSGSFYSKNIMIVRKSVTNLSESNLADWEIIPNGNGGIDYNYTISTQATSDFRTVSKTEGVVTNADFSEIRFKSVAGKLKPIKFTFDDKTTKLDIGEFKDKLTYDNINAEEAEIKLNLNTSANAQFKVDGTVNVNHPGETRSEAFNALVPSSSTVINFANLINNTSGSLPDEFILKGTAIVNPEYKENVSVTETDTIGGTALIEIPLNAQVTGGTVIDTVEIDDSDIDEDDADRLNNAELTIEITNKIAAGGTFSGVLLDGAGEKLMDIPPREVTSGGTTSNLIKLVPAETDENGEVKNPGYTTQKIEIFGDDVKKFIKGKKLIMNIDFDTASPTRTVKFRYTDEIIIRVTAVASIKVSE